MANTVIRLKKSSISGREPTALEHGELAINYTDGKLFYKDDANVIQRISGGANSFMYMNVAGTMLVAGVLADVLTIDEGNNIEINADAITNKYTITANLKPSYDVANAAFALANNVYNVSTVISNTFPSNPVQGKLWWNNVLGTMFIYYIDEDGTASWVEAVPNGGGTSGGSSANLTPVFQVANAAFAKANAANVLAYNTGIGANNYSGSMSNASNAYANSILTIAQAAFDRANSSNDVLFVAASFNTANAAYDKANAANVLAHNTGIGANNYAGVMANAANSYAASLTPNLAPVFIVANSAYDKANTTGYTQSSITIFPTDDYGNGESFITQSTDAFGVALIPTFNLMDPIGRLETLDLGTL